MLFISATLLPATPPATLLPRHVTPPPCYQHALPLSLLYAMYVHAKHNQPSIDRVKSHTTWKNAVGSVAQCYFHVSSSVISGDVGRRVPFKLPYPIISTEFACDDFGGKSKKKSVHKFKFIVSLLFGAQ